MSVNSRLQNFVKVVSDEADRNPDFAERLRKALDSSPAPRGKSIRRPVRDAGSISRRPANRRSPAVLDPVMIAQRGEDPLRKSLESLALEQLKDIVADYGMDQRRLVMKWKTPARVIDHIVEVSVSRARKGDAFRS